MGELHALRNNYEHDRPYVKKTWSKNESKFERIGS